MLKNIKAYPKNEAILMFAQTFQITLQIVECFQFETISHQKIKFIDKKCTNLTNR